MKSYWIGAGFIIFGMYTLTRFDYWEAALYISIGAGFITMDLLRRPSIKKTSYYRFLQILSWIITIAAILLLLIVLRMDAYGIG